MFPPDELDKKIDKLLQDVGYRGRGSQRGVDLQQDLSDCASLMYDKAYNIFQKNINQFYEYVILAYHDFAISKYHRIILNTMIGLSCPPRYIAIYIPE